MKKDALAKVESLTKHVPEGDWKDFVRLVAMDIGKSVTCYIETMYPDAVKHASSTFLLSVRNHTHNEIVAALEVEGGAAAMLTRIREREVWRRKHKAAWKKIRETEARRCGVCGSLACKGD